MIPILNPLKAACWILEWYPMFLYISCGLSSYVCNHGKYFMSCVCFLQLYASVYVILNILYSNINLSFLRRSLLNGLFIMIVQGPPNKKSICTTCEGNFQNCPGHYGYLKLELPVYNIGYFNFILDILKCICKVT